MTGERPVQAGDLVRIIANWGTYYWKKGQVVRVVKRVENVDSGKSFYLCETVWHKRTKTQKILFRFEFEPVACHVGEWATDDPKPDDTCPRTGLPHAYWPQGQCQYCGLPDTSPNAPQEAPRDAD